MIGIDDLKTYHDDWKIRYDAARKAQAHLVPLYQPEDNQQKMTQAPLPPQNQATVNRTTRLPEVQKRKKVIRSKTGFSVILEAAAQLGSRFTLQELIVAAWKLSPSLFGLRGFESDYPDSKRVEVNIWGMRGMVRVGLLVRLNDGRFSVSKSATTEKAS